MIRKVEERQKVQDKLPGGKEMIYKKDDVDKSLFSNGYKEEKVMKKKR